MAPRRARRQVKALAKPAQDHALPTQEEWEKMKTFACFAVTDDDDELHKFMRGETATVLPHHYPPGAEFPEHEYWVVKIREIRGVIHDEDDTNDVWAKVQWYYAPEDAAGVVKSFDTSACSPFERIFSDHFDFVSSESFNEIITIHELNDEDIEQKYINPDVFFTRYTIERQSRRLQPKPGGTSCLCSKPYNPTSEDPGSLMHFCPRPSCRRWYHQSCLLAHAPNNNGLGTTSPKQSLRKKQKLTKTLSSSSSSRLGGSRRGSRNRSPSSHLDLNLDLLANSPDTDKQIPLRRYMKHWQTPGEEEKRSAKRRRRSLRSASTAPNTTPTKTRSAGAGRGGGAIATPTSISATRSPRSAYGGAFTGLPGITGTPSPSKSAASTGKRSALKTPTNASPGKKRKTVVFETKFSTPPLPLLRLDLDGEYDDEDEDEDEDEKDENDAALLEALESLPQGLVRVAQQPIVRGRLFAKGGVSGNVRAVVKARRLVYDLLGDESEEDDNDDEDEDEDAEGETDEDEIDATAALDDEDEDEDEDENEDEEVEVEGALTRSGSSKRSTRSRSRAANSRKKPIKAKVKAIAKMSTKNKLKIKGMNWEEVVFGSGDAATIDSNPLTMENVEVKVKGGKKALPALVCPSCRSAI